MKVWPAACLGAAALAALCAVHPVRPIFPKRNALFGLVLHAQDADAAHGPALDAELLQDLPRIHPDGRGRIRLSHEGRAAILSGTIADPYSGGWGAAVFPIVDGKRIAEAPTFYDRRSFRITLPHGAGDPRRLSVGLVAYDERGYFRLDYLPRR